MTATPPPAVYTPPPPATATATALLDHLIARHQHLTAERIALDDFTLDLNADAIVCPDPLDTLLVMTEAIRAKVRLALTPPAHHTAPLDTRLVLALLDALEAAGRYHRRQTP